MTNPLSMIQLTDTFLTRLRTTSSPHPPQLPTLAEESYTAAAFAQISAGWEASLRTSAEHRQAIMDDIHRHCARIHHQDEEAAIWLRSQ